MGNPCSQNVVLGSIDSSDLADQRVMSLFRESVTIIVQQKCHLDRSKHPSIIDNTQGKAGEVSVNYLARLFHCPPVDTIISHAGFVDNAAKGDWQLVCKVSAAWVSLLVFLEPIPIWVFLVQGQAQTSSLELDERKTARK